MLRGIAWINDRLAVNVLAADAKNAADIRAQAGKSVLVGIVTKGLTTEAAIERVLTVQAYGVPVSVGLGAGDAHQWRVALDVAVATQPTHLNQVFPTAGYANGQLQQAFGEQATVVNALISPTGRPGWVRLHTGPYSAEAPAAEVPVEMAAALLKDCGVPSVKFFPLNGALDELAVMARAAAAAGIPMFEPTGGVDAGNLAAIASICLKEGCRYVVPHVYSAAVDKATGLTVPARVAELVQILSSM